MGLVEGGATLRGLLCLFLHHHCPELVVLWTRGPLGKEMERRPSLESLTSRTVADRPSPSRAVSLLIIWYSFVITVIIIILLCC